jgi:molybdenum cofactor guanylyltransferase
MKRPLYIFCGGGSRRMGQDKALLTLENETLLDRQIRRCSNYFDEITLLSGTNRYESECRQLPDILPDAGPLSGLLTAFSDARDDSPDVAVIPVDLPFIAEETLRRLSSVTFDDHIDACLIRHDELIQPLAGVYRTGLISELQPRVNEGHLMVMKFLERLQIDYLSVGLEELKNINYPDDYKQISR